MSRITEIEKDYKIGQAIFKQLFALNDKDLKEKLIDIIGDNHGQVLTNNCVCKRLITNEEPYSIELWFYNGIIVDWFGISSKSEHGIGVLLVNFNKHFKL